MKIYEETHNNSISLIAILVKGKNSTTIIKIKIS
jgi:hypothetical protein